MTEATESNYNLLLILKWKKLVIFKNIFFTPICKLIALQHLPESQKIKSKKFKIHCKVKSNIVQTNMLSSQGNFNFSI